MKVIPQTRRVSTLMKVIPETRRVHYIIFLLFSIYKWQVYNRNIDNSKSKLHAHAIQNFTLDDTTKCIQ
jgi:hypothetical protein